MVGLSVQVSLNKKDVLVYQEAQTFVRQQVAQVWAKRRETELAKSGGIERACDGSLETRSNQVVAHGQRRHLDTRQLPRVPHASH